MSRQHERLKQRIADLLDGSLGLNILPGWFNSAWPFRQPALAWNNAYLAGLRIGMSYAFLFCGIPWLLYCVGFLDFPKPSWPLFFLQIYGSFWSGWATTTTRITSSSISKTIENDIIPELSAPTVEKIERELRRRFEKGWLLRISWGIAVISAATAGYLAYHDASKVAKPSIGEIVWWSVGWSILFATAAKVVNVSRFYRLFAAHLTDESGKLFAMDPAHSTLVISVASVAQRMVLFWFGIAVSIAVVIPVGVLGLPGIHFSTASEFFSSLSSNMFQLDLSNNWFVLVEVPITGFFSIGLGTIVFLRSEAAIRGAVKDVTRSTLCLIEREVADLSNRLKELDEAHLKRLIELNALHNGVAKAGSYRSFIISGLSVLVPFVVPLVSLFFQKQH